MRLKSVALLALVIGIGAWVVESTLQAQARRNDANISMMDNCSETTPPTTPWRVP
jgi:hypothetical protein